MQLTTLHPDRTIKTMSKLLAFIFISSLFLSGCTVVPVYNIVDAPIHAKNANLNSIKKAIHHAAARTGWRTKNTSPGLISAKYQRGSSVATATIAYSTKTFSIKLADAKNLEFNGSTIHRKYNKWVIKLDKEIMIQLHALNYELD